MKNIDLKKIKVVSERGIYRIKYSNDKLKIRTPVCIIPFGQEKYGHHYIVNLEFDDCNDNSKRYISLIEEIERLFHDIETIKDIDIPPRFKIDINKCYFISSLKDRSLGYNKIYHHRCYINSKEPFNTLINSKDKFEAEINLDKIWIHDDSYGLIWHITNIYKQ